MRPPSQGTKPYQTYYLSVCCVCMHMYSFAALIRWTPPLMSSDTAITDHHYYITFSGSEHTGCRYPGKLDQKNRTTSGSRTLDLKSLDHNLKIIWAGPSHDLIINHFSTQSDINCRRSYLETKKFTDGEADGCRGV